MDYSTLNGGQTNAQGINGQGINALYQSPLALQGAQTRAASNQGQLYSAEAAHAGDQLAATQLTEADKMSRFNQVYGLLGGQLGKLGNGGVYSAGGQNSAAPPITTGPVLNPQQIQQQVNQSSANVDKSTATNIQHNNSELGGRGFGSNSPLSMMLNQAAQGQGLATKTSNETNTRLNAANANSQNLLNTQQALSNQWATGNQLDINRRAPVIQQQTALLGALAGLV